MSTLSAVSSLRFRSHNMLRCAAREPVKAALQYCSQLETWFSTRFTARFSTSLCGFVTRFRPAFDFFCRNPGREPQHVRWFVRVLDKWNV